MKRDESDHPRPRAQIRKPPLDLIDRKKEYGGNDEADAISGRRSKDRPEYIKEGKLPNNPSAASIPGLSKRQTHGTLSTVAELKGPNWITQAHIFRQLEATGSTATWTPLKFGPD